MKGRRAEKPSGEKMTIYFNKEVDDIEDALKVLGYEDGSDYYQQKVYRVTYHMQARSCAILTENEVEEYDHYPPDDDYEIEEVLHKDKEEIGHVFTDTDDKEIDINEVMRWLNIKLCSVRKKGYCK
jgi:hypothetical protein